MTPVYQTKQDAGDGNCFAACVASILDKKIEDVDIDVATCDCLDTLIAKTEEKAKCKIYYVSHEAILDGIVRTSERYCFAEVCSSVINGNPYGNKSVWHVVVCEISENGEITLIFNPDKSDQRKKSVREFPAIRKLFFVKAA